ncbi:hypothetical protein D3C81_1702990 [compost metagenome]
MIGHPEPSTGVPAGVPGHLSNLSDTPSPSASALNVLTVPSKVLTRCFNASTSFLNEGSFNSSYNVATGLAKVKFCLSFEPKVNSKPAITEENLPL